MRSISDLLSSAQNIATALSNITTTMLGLFGVRSSNDISTATQVHNQVGRICTVSVTTAGTTTGGVYDSNSASSPSSLIFVIPNTVGTTVLQYPFFKGLVVVPGTGQVVSVAYS